MSYKINVVIEKDEYGYYAYCPELSGCQTQGDSIEEVLINIKEAVELYLETLRDHPLIRQCLKFHDLNALWAADSFIPSTKNTEFGHIDRYNVSLMLI